MPIVSLEGSKNFEVVENKVIYDALEEQGEDLPHGCLSGSCGACKIEVLEGYDNLSKPSAIEQNTITSIIEDNALSPDKKVRLSCRAKVLGDCKITPIKL